MKAPHFEGKKAPRKYRVLAVLDAPITQYDRLVFEAGDIVGMTSHRAMVEASARLEAPKIRITRFLCHKKQGYDLRPGLKKILKHLEKGHPLDAVNISVAQYISRNKTKIRSEGRELSTAEYPLYRNVVIDHLKNSQPALYETICLLEKVAAKVPVFIGAGNETDDDFNALLLARGIVGVGALGQDGEKWEKSADHALVAQWERGILVPLPVRSYTGKVKGFVLNQLSDQCLHSPSARFFRTSFKKDSKIQMLKTQIRYLNLLGISRYSVDIHGGTSYASPQAAAKAALNREV